MNRNGKSMPVSSQLRTTRHVGPHNLGQAYVCRSRSSLGLKMWRCFVVRTAVLLPILIVLTDGVGAATAVGTQGARVPVAVRAPLSAGVLRAMARRRVSADAAVADY